MVRAIVDWSRVWNKRNSMVKRMGWSRFCDLKKKKKGANLVRFCCNVVMEVELWWVETSNWSQRRAVKSTSVVFNGEVRDTGVFFVKVVDW